MKKITFHRYQPDVTPSRVHSDGFHAQLRFVTARAANYEYHLRKLRDIARHRPLIYRFDFDDVLADVSVHFRARFNWRLNGIGRRCDCNNILCFTLTGRCVNADNTTGNIVNAKLPAMPDARHSVQHGLLVLVRLQNVQDGRTKVFVHFRR